MLRNVRNLFGIEENKLLNKENINLNIPSLSTFSKLNLIDAATSSSKFNSKDFSVCIFNLISAVIGEVSKDAICNISVNKDICKNLKAIYEVYVEHNLSEENKNIIKNVTMKSFYNTFISDKKQKEILDKLSKDSKFNESMFDLLYEFNDIFFNIKDIKNYLNEIARNPKPIQFYTIFEPLLELKEFTEEDLEKTIYSYLIENHSRSNNE